MLIKKDRIKHFLYRNDFNKKLHDRISSSKIKEDKFYHDLYSAIEKRTYTIYEDMVCKKYIRISGQKK